MPKLFPRFFPLIFQIYFILYFNQSHSLVEPFNRLLVLQSPLYTWTCMISLVKGIRKPELTTPIDFDYIFRNAYHRKHLYLENLGTHFTTKRQYRNSKFVNLNFLSVDPNYSRSKRTYQIQVNPAFPFSSHLCDKKRNYKSLPVALKSNLNFISKITTEKTCSLSSVAPLFAMNENSNDSLERKVSIAVQALYNASASTSTNNNNLLEEDKKRLQMHKLCLVNAGVGGALNNWLLSTPGASSTLVDAQVPYSKEAFLQYLESNLKYNSQQQLLSTIRENSVVRDSFKFVSSEASIALAEAAVDRAITLKTFEDGLGILHDSRIKWLGLSITASVVSNYPHKGKHRAFISLSVRNDNKLSKVDTEKESRDKIVEHFIKEGNSIEGKDSLYSPRTYTEENQVTYTYYIELEKGKRNRIEEDELVSRVSLAILCHHTVKFVDEEAKSKSDALTGINSWFEYLDINSPLPITMENVTEKLEDSLVLDKLYEITDLHHRGKELQIFNYPELLKEGKAKHIVLIPHKGHDNNIIISNFPDLSIPPESLIYPGSFNPLHEGHVGLMKAASSKIKSLSVNPDFDRKSESVLEITIFNADKGMVSHEDVKNRLHQIWSLNPFQIVILTSFPLFTQKVSSFPRCYFVVGTDTLERILDPKYYDNSIENMISSLDVLHAQGVKFIVGGRKKEITFCEKKSKSEISNVGEIPKTGVANGTTVETFMTLEDLIGLNATENSNHLNKGIKMPPRITEMFIGLSEDDFRLDISSTELRRKLGDV